MEFLQASGITLEMLTSGAPLPKISHVPNGLAVGLWQTAQNLNLQFYEVISWLSNFTEENAEINAEALRAQLHRTKAFSNSKYGFGGYCPPERVLGESKDTVASLKKVPCTQLLGDDSTYKYNCYGCCSWAIPRHYRVTSDTKQKICLLNYIY